MFNHAFHYEFVLYQGKIIFFFNSSQCNCGFELYVSEVCETRVKYSWTNKVIAVMTGKILKTEITNDIKIYKLLFVTNLLYSELGNNKVHKQ